MRDTVATELFASHSACAIPRMPVMASCHPSSVPSPSSSSDDDPNTSHARTVSRLSRRRCELTTLRASQLMSERRTSMLMPLDNRPAAFSDVLGLDWNDPERPSGQSGDAVPAALSAFPLLRSTRVVPSSCWRSNASRVRTRSTPGNSRDDFLDDVGETCWVKRDDCAYTGDAGSKSWLAGGVCVGVPGRSSEILRADATPSSARATAASSESSSSRPESPL